MCNDFGNRIPYDEYLRAFNQIRAPVKISDRPAEHRTPRRHLADR
jgi:hypothetical protein